MNGASSILAALVSAPLFALATRRITVAYCGAAPPYPWLLLVGGLGTTLAAVTAPGTPGLVGSLVLVWGLVTLTAIDLRILRLPDPLTLPLIILGLAWSAWSGADPVDHAIGAAAGYSVLALIAFLYRRLRHREGLGLGDAKLLAAAGAWLGWQALPGVVLIGSLTALGWVALPVLVGRKIPVDAPLPFGPALALAIWFAWVFMR